MKKTQCQASAFIFLITFFLCLRERVRVRDRDRDPGHQRVFLGLRVLFLYPYLRGLPLPFLEAFRPQALRVAWGHSLYKPKEELSKAFSLLQDEDWEKKVEGLRLIQALAEHHSEVLLPKLRSVCLAVTDEVKNLRLVVSRAAMVTLAHLFAHLQKNMDKELDIAALMLLHRSGESSLFIKEAVELALSYMVQHCSSGQVLKALLAGGFSHKNSAVRTSVSLHLMKLVQVMGASRVLTGRKQFTDRILPALTKLAFDSAQDVRLHARNALQILASHKVGVSMIHKFVSPRDRPLIDKMLLI